MKFIMRRRVKDSSTHLILIFLAVLMLYPFVFMLMTSFKDTFQFYHSFWAPTSPLHWENYFAAWKEVKQYILNSIIVTSSSCVGILITSSIAAYVFARYKFPGSTFLFYAIFFLLMIPSILTLIPSFILVRDLGLLNTRWVLILPYIATGQAFAILVLRTFFISLPNSLFEAAKIDGATSFQIYYKIALPLSKPILATIAIKDALLIWNDFLWPLVTIQDDNLRVVTTGIYKFSGEYSTNYGPLFSGYTIVSIPMLILFIFSVRYFVRGFSAGTMKL